MHLLYNTPFIQISFDHLENWLYANWRGPQNFDSVLQGGQAMLQLLQQERCHKVLNDNRLVTSIWSEAAQEGGQEWFPQMAAAGLQYFAWVYSPNAYSRLSTDLTLQYTPETGPIIATFDNIDTARNWLRNV